MLTKPEIWGGTWSPEVLAFSAAHGVTSHLDWIAELTLRTIPSACHLSVLVEDDPSIPDFRYLTFRVEVKEFDWNQLYATRAQWTEALWEHWPDARSVSIILDIDISE
jgi:hypothetical protein